MEKKRALTMLFCAALTLALGLAALPGAALAANAASVWIWGKEIDGTTPYYVNGANGAQGTVSQTEPAGAAWNAHYDPSAGTLTLKDLFVADSNAVNGNTTCAIYAESDLRVALAGTSEVSTAAGGGATCAVRIKGSLLDVTEASGGGTLTATAGTAGGTNPSYGLYVGDRSSDLSQNHSLTMSSGTITAISGASGSTSSAGSCGVYLAGFYTASCTLTMRGGTLTGRAADAQKSQGVLLYSGSQDQGKLDIQGGTLCGTGASMAGDGRSSIGVACLSKESITVSGNGKLEGTGGAVSGSGGFSAGVSSPNGTGNVSITVKDNGSIIATGGDTATSRAFTVGKYPFHYEGGVVVASTSATAATRDAIGAEAVFTTTLDPYYWRLSGSDSFTRSTGGANPYVNQNGRAYVELRTSATISVIAVSASPAAGGTATGGGAYGDGQSVTVAAAPNAHYRFVGWKENGSTVSASPSYAFIATEDRTLAAEFELIPRVISVSASPAAGGTVTGGGTYGDGQRVTVAAAPNPHYRFVSWKENGSTVSASPSYAFIATADRTLAAEFAENANPPASENSISGIAAGQIYPQGATVTFTANGGGMHNAAHQAGDMRWQPTRWATNPAGDFTGGVTQSFSTAGVSLGAHTLTVTFTKQRYDGSGWADIAPAVTDVKIVEFAIIPPETPPKTGDSNHPALWLALLGLAGAGWTALRRRINKNRADSAR